jgi:outer membrane protein assembly factor BamB
MGLAPAIGASNDLIGVQGGRLLSFNLASHSIGWERKGSFSGQATVADGMIYVVANNQVEAHNEDDGALAWLWIPPEGTPTGPMIATKNMLFVSTAARTYAVDLVSHRHVWSYAAGGKLALSAQGVLLISQTKGKLTAITAR